MSSFDDLLDKVLARSVASYGGLTKAERLSGGASQETYRIEVIKDGKPLTLAMRRSAGGEEPPEDSPYPGLAVEAKLMQVAKAAGVPEPEVYYVLQAEDGLGPGFIMEWLDGETLGARINKVPELDEIRPKLAYECGQVLARIHNIDLTATGLENELETHSTEEFVHTMWDRYQEMDTPQPMIDYSARWLLDNLPPENKFCLVHNDFRNGNIMVTPNGINAVLDWETALIGDPIRDLGWICTNSWRFGRRELEVGGFGKLEDLLAGYEVESGIKVDPAHVKFWEVFGSYWWAVGCLGMAARWREGLDATVERPGIARRSSECQVDCANLIIPGPVELVSECEPLSSLDLPNTEELLVSVRDFLRQDLRAELQGRNNFLSLVASNSLDIVLREMKLGPAHLAKEMSRLKDLLGTEGPLLELRCKLSVAIRDGSMSLDHPGLADHLRNTVVNQLAIDQPRYSGLAAALNAA